MPAPAAKPDPKPSNSPAKRKRSGKRSSTPTGSGASAKASQRGTGLFQIRFELDGPDPSTLPLEPLPDGHPMRPNYTHKQGKCFVRVETDQERKERHHALREQLQVYRREIEASGGGRMTIEEILKQIDEDRGVG